MAVSRDELPANLLKRYIYEYPLLNKSGELESEYSSLGMNHILIGDAHGNALKILHILIERGVADIKVSDEDFKKAQGATPEEKILNCKKQKYKEIANVYDGFNKTIEGSLLILGENGQHLQEEIERFKKTKNTEISENLSQSISSVATDIRSTTACINEFDDLIKSSLVFNDSIANIVFDGDTLSDRGQNDFMTINLFNLMSDNDIQYRVLASNHDAGFLYFIKSVIPEINHYETGNPYDIANVPVTPSDSLKQLGLIVHYLQLAEDVIQYINDEVPEAKILIGDDLTNLSNDFTGKLTTFTKQNFLKHFRLIDYQYNPKDNLFTFVSHAPVGLQVLEQIVTQLKRYFPNDPKLKYDDSSVESLMRTIDSVNIKCEQLYDKGMLNKLFSNPKSAFNRLIWERVEEKEGGVYDTTIDMPNNKNGINFKFVHGHDTPGPLRATEPHIVSIDNIRGKSSTASSEKGRLLLTKNSDSGYREEDFDDAVLSIGFNTLEMYRAFQLSGEYNKLMHKIEQVEPTNIEEKLANELKQDIANFNKILLQYPDEAKRHYDEKLKGLTKDIPSLQEEVTGGLTSTSELLKGMNVSVKTLTSDLNRRQGIDESKVSLKDEALSPESLVNKSESQSSVIDDPLEAAQEIEALRGLRK